MVKKYILLVFLFVFVNSLIVYAADNETSSSKSVDKEKAYDWLYNESKKENWGGNAEIISWVVLALKNNAKYDYNKALDKLEDIEDDSNWDDDIYATAMAIIALKKTGNNVDNEIEWLYDRQEEVLESGNWYIQFLTEDEEAQCNILYEDEEYKEFTINKTEITDSSESCGVVGESWVDFEECVKDDDADMYETFEIDCLSSEKVETSILFKNSDKYYIVDQSEPLEIENSCFYGNNNDCTCLDTQYGSWAMYVVNDPDYRYYTLPYLRSNCNDNVQGNIFLYMLTSSDEYYNYLVSEDGQMNDGSFDADEYKTALALIAMKGKSSSSGTVSKAVNWLAHKQRADGSWDGSIKTTAAVLYALTADISPTPQTNQSTCGDKKLDNLTEQCEFASQCGNSSLVCNSLCKCVPQTGCVRSEECSYLGPNYVCKNGKCEYEGECDCDIDEECNSAGVCVPKAECGIDDPCEEGYECENGKCIEKVSNSWVTWLIVFLIVVVGLVGAYFGYKKFFKKKGSKPAVFKPGAPFTPRSSYTPTKQNVPVTARQPQSYSSGTDKMEEQLDQSLKKARDLLRGK